MDSLSEALRRAYPINTAIVNRRRESDTSPAKHPKNENHSLNDLQTIEDDLLDLRRNGQYREIQDYIERSSVNSLSTENICIHYIASKYQTGFSAQHFIEFYKEALNSYSSAVIYESFFNQSRFSLSDLGINSPIGLLHFPTTGGTSIRNYVRSSDSSSPYIHFGHRIVIDSDDCVEGEHFQKGIPNGRIVSLNRRLISSCFIFFTVRNIFAYFYSLAQIMEMELNRVIHLAMEEEEGLLTRRMIFNMPFAQPSGDLVADWVVRTEYLAEDLRALSKAVPLVVDLGPARNVRSKGDYRDAYSSTLVDLVSNHWRDDIALYGFDFENGYSDTAVLRGDVRAMKGRVSYKWRDNRLSVANRAIDQ